MGLAENFVQPGYHLVLPRGPWPGRRSPAEAVASGTPVNETYPYSGAWPGLQPLLR